MNQEEKKTHHRKKLRNVFKIFSWLLFSFIILFISTFIIVFTYETEITNKVLGKLNQSINGEITIKNLQIDPFIQYPNISIDLQGAHIKDTNENTIVKVNAFYIGFDIIEVFKGTFDIKEITLEEGVVNIVNSKNGLNLENIFPIDTTLIEEDINEDEKPIILTLKKLSFKDVTISYIDKIIKDTSTIKIEEIETNIDYNIIHDIVDLKFETELVFLEMSSFADKNILNKEIDLKTAFKYNLNSEVLDLREFELDIIATSLKANGIIDLKNEELNKLNISIQLEEINKLKPIINQYLPSDLELIKHHNYNGKIEVYTKISGTFSNPYIEGETSIEEFSIKNNNSNFNLYDLSTKINFKGNPLDTLFNPYLIVENINLSSNFLILNGDVKMQNWDSTSANIKLSVSNLNAIKNNFNITELNGYNADEIFFKIKFKNLALLKDDVFEKILNENMELDLVNLTINNKDIPINVKRADMQLLIQNNELNIPNLKVKTLNSDFEVNFKLNNIKSFVNNKNGVIQSNLNINSNKFDLAEFLYFDKQLAADYGDVFNNTNINFEMNTNYDDLVNYKYIPKGNYTLNNLSTKPTKLFSEIKKIKTAVTVSDTTLNITDLTFLIGKSDIHINTLIKNYEAIFNDNKNPVLEIKNTITAKDIYTEDFNYFNGKKIIHEDYDHEDVRNLHTTVKTIVNMKDVNESIKNIPNIDFEIDHLNLEIPNRNFVIDSTVLAININNDDIYIKDIHSHFGKSDIKINGKLIQPFTYLEKGPRKDDIKINIESNNLDVDEIFTFTTSKYQKKIEQKRLDTTKTKTNKTDTIPLNICKVDFPNVQITTNIKKIVYNGSNIEKIITEINSFENRIITIPVFRMNIAGGQLKINNYQNNNPFTFDARDEKNIYTKGIIKFNKLNLDELFKLANNLDQDYLTSDNIKGYISDNITIDKLFFFTDLSPDLDRSKIVMPISLKQGALINFPGLTELADIYKTTDLSHLKFDDLDGSYIIENGKFSFSRSLKISSPIGNFQMEGNYGINDGEMNFVIQLPMSVITGTVGQMTKISNKKNANEVKDKKVKGGVSTVHLITTSDPLEIKLYDKLKYEDLSEEGDIEKMYYKIYTLKQFSLKDIETKLDK